MPDSAQVKGPVTIEQAIAAGARDLSQSPSARLDARILMRHALGADDAGLIARATQELDHQSAGRFCSLIRRRVSGEPVAYITGVKEFWSLEFTVTPDVLVPRDDSGALIEAVLARRERQEFLRIADLGTGSGCLLCTLLTEFPRSHGFGIDCSDRALEVAKMNADALGVGERAQFVKGDWLSGVAGPFDIIIANPPYIRASEKKTLSPDVAVFEPSGALFAGDDGLDAYREIVPQLPSRLSNEGLAVMECDADQADWLAGRLATEAGEAGVFTIKDLAGRPRGAGFDRQAAANRGKKRV
ncbi:MAG: peptide chain release factor N(5)-glutamine methyltransferase [Pseudomonadota bacterium]